jgi:hypothetical protein
MRFEGKSARPHASRSPDWLGFMESPRDEAAGEDMQAARRRLTAALIALTLFGAAPANGQASPDVWRSFAQTIDVGSEVDVRLVDGTRFRAVLIDARDEALLLQPKTRRTVPVQPVPYDAIAALQRHKSGGVSAGKAAAIGVATGAGAFFALIAIMIALVSD